MADWDDFLKALAPGPGGVGGSFGTMTPQEATAANTSDILRAIVEQTATLPQRAFEASENLRQGGTYDPGPALEAATMMLGVGGAPVLHGRGYEALLDTPGFSLGSGSRRLAPATVAASRFPQYAEKYPQMAPGTPAVGKDTGRAYFEKTHSKESEAFAKARDRVIKEMKKSGYARYYDPAKRAPIDPSVYPTKSDMAKQALPAKPETIAKYRKMYDTPEARQRLKAAYQAGKSVPGAEHWYWVKQVYDDYVKELGPELGRQKFQTDFAGSMAATTGGADPTSNFLTAHYANYMRNKALPFPKVSAQDQARLAQFAKKYGARMPDKKSSIASYLVPYPVGGRYVGQNLKTYEKAFSDPNFRAFGADNPKRFDFQYSFLGNLDSATIDEQMSNIIKPGMNVPEGDSYGVATQVVRDVAREMGIDPQYFQDVAWAGFKKMKTEGAGKKFDYAGPMIEHINAAIERTHRLTGMARDEIVRRGLIRGEIPLYGIGGAAAGGVAIKQQGGQSEP